MPPDMDWEQSLYGDRTQQRSEPMAVIDGGALVGRILKEQRVKYMFAVNGGHTFPILANLRDNGVKLIHMRHEQATAYAADALCAYHRHPGRLLRDRGLRLTNAVTGLCVAGLTNSAVVCSPGSIRRPKTTSALSKKRTASEVCRTFSKFVKRVLDWSTIEVDLRQAFREAMSTPRPCFGGDPARTFFTTWTMTSRQRKGAKVYGPRRPSAPRATRARSNGPSTTLKARRPLIVAGDGIFWSVPQPSCATSPN